MSFPSLKTARILSETEMLIFRGGADLSPSDKGCYPGCRTGCSDSCKSTAKTGIE